MALYQNKTVYRVIAFLLVFACLFCFFPQPDAHAAVVIDDVAKIGIGVAVSALAAYGVNLLINGTDSSGFSSFFRNNLQDFCDDYYSGASFGSVFGSGVIAESGKFILSHATAYALAQFCDWFVDHNNISASPTVITNDCFWNFGGQTFVSGFCENSGYVRKITAYGTIFPLSSSVNIISYSNPTIGPFSIDSDSYGYRYGSVEGCSAIASYPPSYTSGKSIIGYGFFTVGSGLPTPHLITADGYAIGNSGSTVYILNSSYRAGSVSASYSSADDFPSVDGSSALAEDYTHSLTVIPGGNGSAPDPDPEADALTNLAITALELGLAGDLISKLSKIDSGSDPGIDSDTHTIREIVESIGAWIRTTFNDFIEVVTDFATTFWSKFSTAVRTIFDDVISAISNGWNSLTEWTSNFWDNASSTISDALEPIGDKLDDIKERFRDNTDEPTTDPISPGAYGTVFPSIWHYVVEWLGYISGFISLILSVWSSLPYAIVLPVYAVVVLVLYFGLYNKFIK